MQKTGFYPKTLVKIVEDVSPVILSDGTSVPSDQIITVVTGSIGLVVSGVSNSLNSWTCVMCKERKPGRLHFRKVLFGDKIAVVPICILEVLSDK